MATDTKQMEGDPDDGGNGLYRCTICGYDDPSLDGVKDHVREKTDSVHRFRRPEEPGVIEYPDNEEEPARHDGDVEFSGGREFALLWEIARNPDATRQQIADSLGVSAGTVLSRLKTTYGVSWDDRMDVIEERFPHMATTNDADDEEEQTEKRTNGNASYSGPDTGIDLTDLDGGEVTIDDTRTVRERIADFREMTSKQQAVALAWVGDPDPDRAIAEIARRAGVSNRYPSRVLGQHLTDEIEALQRAVEDGDIALDQLWSIAEIDHANTLTEMDAYADFDHLGQKPEEDVGDHVCDDCGNSYDDAHGLKVHRGQHCDGIDYGDGEDAPEEEEYDLIDYAGESPEPAEIPRDDDDRGWADSQMAAAMQSDDDDMVTVALEQDDVFEILTTDAIPEHVQRAIFEGLVR